MRQSRYRRASAYGARYITKTSNDCPEDAAMSGWLAGYEAARRDAAKTEHRKLTAEQSEARDAAVRKYATGGQALTTEHLAQLNADVMRLGKSNTGLRRINQQLRNIIQDQVDRL